MSKQKQLPPKPHIDSLKKQARQLLRAHQTAQPEAAQRIRMYLPHLRPASDPILFQTKFTLQDAQCVVAREYGQMNWAKLVKAVEILRQADADLFPLVEAALQRGQPIHVLPPNEQTAEDIAKKLAARLGKDIVLLVLHERRRPKISLETWKARLSAAEIVVSAPDNLGFLAMDERLQKPKGPFDFDRIFSKAHAVVNVAFDNERTPLTISGYDEETGGARELISMYLTEFYNLYGSITDQRY